jgi:hypothetical protein
MSTSCVDSFSSCPARSRYGPRWAPLQERKPSPSGRVFPLGARAPPSPRTSCTLGSSQPLVRASSTRRWSRLLRRNGPRRAWSPRLLQQGRGDQVLSKTWSVTFGPGRRDGGYAPRAWPHPAGRSLSRIYGCRGMAPNLADLLQRPRKHVLQIATFSNGVGMVVICSKCGHYATSNRPCGLHKHVCSRGFTSKGAEKAYERVSQGMHPKHERGDAKVLDPCMEGAALLALGAQQAPS